MANAIAGGESTGSPKYDKWEAENDLRHLTEAKKIQKDPHRMKHARRAATEKLAEMKHMQDIAKGQS